MPAAKRATKRTTAKKRLTAEKAKKAVRKTAGKTVKRGGKRNARSAPRDAIAVLKRDHRAVEQLFKRFERAGDGAVRTKRKLVDQMIEELVFYPAVRSGLDDADSDVLEALEEHHVVKVLLRELEDLDASHERFDAKVTVLIENVRHHVEEEEHELFPEVRDGIPRSKLLDMGATLEAAKPTVPSRPHPWAPDEPPANTLVGGAVAALDKARTIGKQTVTRVRADARSR